MTDRLVVIGGDAAGMSAVSQARRRRGPDDLEIVVFERGRHTSYSACGIPYLVADVVHDAEQLIARRPEVFRSRFATEVHLRHEVVGIDLDRRVLTVRDLVAGGERDEPFDHLMVATGATPVRPKLPGADADGIFGVQVLDDGVALRRRLDRKDVRRAVVVGAGYIGLEMAEALVQRGVEVTVVEQAPQPMATLDPDMGSLVADAMRRLGIVLRLGESVTGFDTAEGSVGAVVTTAGTLPADLVVLGLGVRPNSGLAAEAGVAVGATGGIVTDRRMRTSAPGVWAAGDCVETFHRVSRRPVTIALGTHANKQGRVAGINIGGGYATFPGVVGTAVTKICGLEIARTGLGEAEATAAGFATEAVVVESTTRAGYFPGAAVMQTKLIVERRSGRLLGAQIVGEENAGKRIDALAIALWNEMTVEEMTGLDLAYAPPFSPVWDPVLIAARKAAERLDGPTGSSAVGTS
jgi:NADPH-dependent 2,4-dienoyl-CoA reductase/sulfur reductase-like enzyme